MRGREPLTPEVLRALTESHSPFWEGQARQALNWAADLIEAGEAVMAERLSPTVTAQREGT